ncbi:MAG: tRNA (adenosine(37)-N6)-threonylcarbamoyltransferase complex transferase subunit TsaD [Candidatus Dormibacteraeota bacterium]|uniref:tRNA N6-adenosine threonylcarbamoyltransferase n=1 Tax=Candidatus Nephthysia bennettiae TaxID=3127016 RepID=A0A934N9N0_9BACT|nr:tRNA (adenosine(37)-N6)-threonylcarbamoyltransferase complex transferase subunit TsaD [Candidatus Dormibacteraeota bacterium]MBJ7610902.1 tRNA (adenosine(37)-N6)-threonylcarbamoyltransferase complex transferase subunit TsaD [Candidatus Dormibacteraeota bacterium]
MAVLAGDREVLANLVYSQVKTHAPFGGVVPELAARAHLERLPVLVDEALQGAGVTGSELDRVAVTRGPGLIGCLLVGIGLSEGLATAWRRPLIGVNHLWGHVYAAFLARQDLEPPLLALVVSGAHSDLVRMPAHGVFEVLGRTRDDAAGEAFDKAARMLGLGYPGGPALDRMARRGDAVRQPLPVPSLPGLEFSFSGLKTALLYRIRELGGLERLDESTIADLSAAFERSVMESLLAKVDAALATEAAAEVVVCGGVAANSLLRRRAAEILEGRARLTVPPLELCTDNAAMIAAAAGHVPAGGGLRADPSLNW